MQKNVLEKLKFTYRGDIKPHFSLEQFIGINTMIFYLDLSKTANTCFDPSINNHFTVWYGIMSEKKYLPV